MTGDALWKKNINLTTVLFLFPVVVPVFLFGWGLSLFFRAEKPLVLRYSPPLSHNTEQMIKYGWTIHGNWNFDGRTISLSPKEKGRLIFTWYKKNESLSVIRIHTHSVNDPGTSLLATLDKGAPERIHLNGEMRKIKGSQGNNTIRIELIAETPEGNAPSLLIRDMEILLYSPDALRLSRIMRALLIFLVLYTLAFLSASLKWNLFRIDKQRIVLLVVIIMAFGFFLRFSLLIERVGHPLDPDARGYYDIALNGKGLFDTMTSIPPYIREPFFIWFIRSAFLIFGDKTDAALRLLTVLLSVAVIPAAFYAGKRLFGIFPAFLASFFCAINPYFINMSARGLRMELYILCVLLFLASIERLGEKDSWKGARCGIAAGICSLTRITSLSFTIPLTLYFAIRKKANPTDMIISLIIPFIMIFPHLRFNYAEKGDPFFSSNIHARFYRNREFAGKAGFMTSEQATADPYGGETISSLGYLFRLHFLPQVFTGTIKGLFRIFFGGYARGGLLGGWKIFFLIYLFGLSRTLFSKKWEWLLVAIILQAPGAFLASMGLDWRLTLHAAPLLYFFTADGISFILLKTGITKIFKIERGG
ncbi:glycosyltransferase family 39 protein [Candidatus Sumerlaeota bacterium]|nr:glycosyltransferase family 39 protein [Candidatus Sumerlaeota bacterium]